MAIWTKHRQFNKHKVYGVLPFYDEKKGLLYFTSRRNELQPAKFDDFMAYQNYISGGMNGLSKIYFVKWKLD